MTPDPPDLSVKTQEALEAGLRRYGAGQYWEAHEAWEAAWLEETGHVRLGLQGLIQLTAAFHKGLRMGSPRGMANLLGASLQKMEHVREHQATFGRIELARLTREIRVALAAAEAWASGATAAFEGQPPMSERFPP